jgi:hypothetical protein
MKTPMPKMGRGKSPLDGYMPGDDPAQAQHDATLRSLSDEQHRGIGQALKDYMDRREAERGTKG